MLMVSTDCHALWLRLWKPCHDLTRFNIEAALFNTYANKYVGNQLVKSLVKQTNFTVTTHDEICSPGYDSSGKCPRAILTGLASLITKKVQLIGRQLIRYKTVVIISTRDFKCGVYFRRI